MPNKVEELEETRFVLVSKRTVNTAEDSSIRRTSPEERWNFSDPKDREGHQRSKHTIPATKLLSRQMDKVSAVLGNYILPNKTWPTMDDRDQDEMIDLKPLVLPSITQSTIMSSVDDEGTLPALSSVSSTHLRAMHQSSILIKPTMVQSISDGRKVRVNSNKIKHHRNQTDLRNNSDLTNDNDLDANYNNRINVASNADLLKDSPVRHGKLMFEDTNNFYTSVTNSHLKNCEQVGRYRTRSYNTISLITTERPQSLKLNGILPALDVSEKQQLKNNSSLSSPFESSVWQANNEKAMNYYDYSPMSSSLDGENQSSPISSLTEIKKKIPSFANHEMKRLTPNSTLVRRGSSLSWELPNPTKFTNNLHRAKSLSIGFTERKQQR
ncbi:hypothetical protein CHUAL_005451 [Chamberlinius hualienensis]